MAPASIVLSRDEAFDVAGSIDDAQVLLTATDYLVVLLELEEASDLMLGRLYPEGS